VKLLQLQKRSMALAGMLMTLYLIIHMLTNLSFFSESRFSQFYSWYNNGMVRWLVLALIGSSLFIHIKAAIRIRSVNAKARTIGYKKHDKFHMPAILVTISIIFLFGFIAVHVFQTLSFDSNDVYRELIQQFQSPWMVLFYLAGLFVLMMHLHHSLANVLQTLGKTSVTHNGLVLAGCLVLAGGFAVIPLYIYCVMP
jgi:succinate dehydrogenase / fumarate reductase, cytochrome b subunit